jgi:hypothetical protein
MAGFVVFTGRSDHESVNVFATELGAALRDLDHPVEIIDLNATDHAARLQAATAAGDRVAISVAGMGLDMRANGNIYAGPGLRLVSILLDHPLLYWDQVAVPIPRRLVTVIAPEDAAFVRAALPGTDCQFLPHGAPAMSAALPWDERDIDVLLCAGRPAPAAEMRQAWAAHGAVTQGRLESALDLVEVGKHPLAAIGEILQAAGVAVPSPPALYPFFVTLDRFLRARERERAVAELRGRDLVLVGSGWEGGMGPLPLRQSRAMMERAKLVLNPMPGYHASHERIFTAAAAGAIAVTTDNDFVRTLPVARVSRQDGAWRETVGALLADDGESSALASTGCAAASAAHTVRHRACALLDLLGQRPD